MHQISLEFIRIHQRGLQKSFVTSLMRKIMDMANNTKGVDSITRRKQNLEYFILGNATIMKQIKEFVEIKHASKLEKAGEKQSGCLFPAVLVQNDGRKDLY